MDPDRYSATLCEANSKIRHANSRLLAGILLFIIIIIPAFVVFPITVVSWGFSGFYIGIGAAVFAFVLFFVAIIGAQKVWCQFKKESILYNPSPRQDVRWNIFWPARIVTTTIRWASTSSYTANIATPGSLSRSIILHRAEERRCPRSQFNMS